MGIKLKDHVNYDIKNWLSKKETKKLFIAAGFKKKNNKSKG
jgi:hypothetical protein